MSHNTDMFDDPFGHQQPVFVIEVFPVARRALEYLLHQGHVLRMNSLQSEVERRFHRPVALENSKHFLRPGDFSGGQVPGEAAGAAQCLGVPQVGFAAPKSGLRLARDFGPLAGRFQQPGHQQQRDEEQIDEAVVGKSSPRRKQAKVSSARLMAPMTYRAAKGRNVDDWVLVIVSTARAGPRSGTGRIRARRSPSALSDRRGLR